MITAVLVVGFGLVCAIVGGLAGVLAYLAWLFHEMWKRS